MLFIYEILYNFTIFFCYLAAMHSISTSASFGNVLTATAERAGKGEEKNEE